MEQSISHYYGSLKDFISFLAVCARERLQDVTEDDMNAYRLHLADRNLKARTMNSYLSNVRLLFGYLDDTQQIFINPTRHLVLPRVKRSLQPVPTEEEIKRLFCSPDLSKTYGIRDRAFLEVAYSTGMRLFEIMSLNLFDPDLERGIVRIMGKGRKERSVPLGKMAVYWLKQYMKEARPKLQTVYPDATALWLGKGGKPVEKARLQQVIKHYARAAKIKTPITVHSLRRACATHMLRNGAHPVQIQMLLGHSSLQTLSQYLKVTITDLKQSHEKSLPGK